MKCMKYGIWLNPTKSNFALEEAKLLCHIISKDGIKIDPERVSAIKIWGTKEKKRSTVIHWSGKFLKEVYSQFCRNIKECYKYAEKGQWNKMDCRR